VNTKSRNEKSIQDNVNVTFDPATGVPYPFSDVAHRAFPLYGVVGMFPMVGRSDYHGLQTNFTKRMSQRWQGSLTYTLSGALGGIDGALLAGYFRGANVDIGNEYLLASIAVVVIGGTSVAGGKANVPGVWGAGLFLVLLLTMLNTFGVSAGVRLLLTGLIIVGVITVAGGEKALR